MSEHLNKNEEPFSDDPQENLKAENEILKLKMQAEFGAMFGNMNGEMTPEMEQMFLQNVLKFEEEWKNRKTITIYELIEQPAYKKLDELSADDVKTETKRLIDLMKEKGVELQVRGRYKAEIIYQFITEEFFNYETDDMRASGMTQHFEYEEFHPNHKLEIEEITHNFLKNWFEQSFDKSFSGFASTMVLPHATPPTIISEEEVLYKIKLVHDSYVKFHDCKLALTDVSFQWDKSSQKGLGHSEGAVKYSAELENGERKLIEGPFKIYFSNEFGLWQIMYFIFPGMRLEDV